MLRSLLSMFSSRGYGFRYYFKSLTHFNFCVQCRIMEKLHSFSCCCLVFPASFKRLFFSHCIPLVPQHKLINIYIYKCILTYITLSLSLSIYIYIYSFISRLSILYLCSGFYAIQCYSNYYSFIIQFEIRECDASSFVLLSQYQGSPVVPCKFQDCLVYFCEICHWNFDKECTESVDCFRQNRHLNNINSSSPKAQNLSIYLCLLKFLSLTPYNFQYTRISTV